MPHDQIEFHPELLSAREREVLDLAVEGHTDTEIARALKIEVSTVNSYWVRIRGKVGFLSRTELVGMVLRHESGLKYAELIAENVRLKAREEQVQRELARSEAEIQALRGGSWHMLALDHTPDATLVCDESACILYANLRAQYTFAAEPGELERMHLWELTILADQMTFREQIPTLTAKDSPPRVVVGIERPFYGLLRDGTNFRGVLIMERFLAPDGMMSLATVREFMEDVEEIIKALRRPFAVL